MQNYTFRLKLIANIWLGLGTIAMVWGVFQLISISWEAMLPWRLSEPARQFWAALRLHPWSEATIIAIGLLLLISGWGLLQRYSWTQMIMVSTHRLFAVYAAVGWIAAQTLQRSAQTHWPPGPFIFVAAIILNGGLALFFASIGTTEALSWLPLQTAHITPSKCEFCGSTLDLQTGACPKCETVPTIQQLAAQKPPMAMLVGSDGSQFWVEPHARTFIGRGSTQNDINLDNPTVSRRHAWIEYKDAHFVLTAMDDVNGTFINNALIRQRALNDGDQVRFGRARFQFHIDRNID